MRRARRQSERFIEIFWDAKNLGTLLGDDDHHEVPHPLPAVLLGHRHAEVPEVRLVSGAKAWCTFAGRANVIALLARTDPARLHPVVGGTGVVLRTPGPARAASRDPHAEQRPEGKP